MIKNYRKPGKENEILGLIFETNSKGTKVHLSTEKITKLTACVDSIIEGTSILDQKICGKLAWFTQSLIGRVGRSDVRHLIRVSRGSINFKEDLTDPLTESLQNIQHLLQNAILYSREIEQECGTAFTDHIICYSDADDLNTERGILAGLVPRQDSVDEGQYFSLEINIKNSEIWAVKEKTILPFELLAAYLTICNFKANNHRTIIFIDSTAAECILRRGSSSTRFINHLVGKMWRSLASSVLRGELMDFVVSRVNTRNNLADAPSRKKWYSVQAKRRIKPKVPTWVLEYITTNDEIEVVSN